MSIEEFGATIEAYTYPDEFAECDGFTEIEDGIFIGQQSENRLVLFIRQPLEMIQRVRLRLQTSYHLWSFGFSF